MATYHLEHRAPREGEQYLFAPLAGIAASGSVVLTCGGDIDTPRYVLTEDRPKSDHPEALLIRVGGTLYSRVTLDTGAVVYNSVTDPDNYHYNTAITEWEDVYDEVPESEPEPKHPTADVIWIIEANLVAPLSETAPVLAIRQDSDSSDLFWYRTRGGSPVNPERITAWEDVDTNGDSK